MQAPGDSKDERHRHVCRVVRQHARCIGDGYAALNRALDVDIVDPGAELGNETQLVAGPGEHAAVDAVSHGRYEHVSGLDGFDQFFMAKGMIVLIEACVEQFLHP